MDDTITRRFEQHRSHLDAVAHRMLGSRAEADDVVQEAWLRLQRVDADEIDNLGAWLTTVVSRLCLNVLRSRATRASAPLVDDATDAGPPVVLLDPTPDPEGSALVADAVGTALLVVLDTLSPAERLAFVLHDMFAVPFEEIAPIVERSPAATRQLASRARRRVQGRTPAPAPDLVRRQEVVDAFFAASRAGDLARLVAVLDPEIELRVATGGAEPLVLRGAETVAGRATMFADPAREVLPAVVGDLAAAVISVDGRAITVMVFTVVDGRIVAIDSITDPDRLAGLEVVRVAAERPPAAG